MMSSTTRNAAPVTGVAAERAAPTARKSAKPKSAAAGPRGAPQQAKRAGQTREDAALAEAPIATPALREVAPDATLAPTRWTQQDCKLTEWEYGQLSVLKKRSLQLGRTMKRSELLRVGLHLMARMSDDELRAVIESATVVPRLRVRR